MKIDFFGQGGVKEIMQILFSNKMLLTFVSICILQTNLLRLLWNWKMSILK